MDLIRKNRGITSKNDYFEDTTGALDGQTEIAEIIGHVDVEIKKSIYGVEITESKFQKWEKIGEVRGTLQPYSQKIGNMSSAGHRQFKKKLFVIKNKENLRVGMRLRLRNVLYNIFNTEEDDVSGFTLTYLKEIK